MLGAGSEGAILFDDFTGEILFEGWLFGDGGGAGGGGGLDFPGGEVDKEFVVVFVPADVEGYFYPLSGGDTIELGDAILDAFELDALGIAVVVGGDDEFAFCEAAVEGLGFVDEFYGSVHFVGWHVCSCIDSGYAAFGPRVCW